MIEKNATTGQVRVNGRVTADNPQAILDALRLDMICTPRQARLAMLATPYGLGNLLQAVQAAVAASNNQSLQIAWEYGTQWERNDANIAALASALDLSPAQLDNLFVLAMTL